MQATITDLRGINQAVIDLSSISLVLGKNGQGKTSIARAVASALTRNALPYPGLKKGEAKALVRRGEKSGSCILVSDDGTVTVSYPKAEVVTAMQPPEGTPLSCGLVRYSDMNMKERSTLLSPILNALPTKEDLSAALDSLSPGDLSAVIDKVGRLGWDTTCAEYATSATEAKGEWRAITGGEQYGSTKAETWEPANFVKGHSLADLNGRLAKAKADLVQANKNAGASEAELNGLRQKTFFIESLESELQALGTQLAHEDNRIAKAEKEIKENPTSTGENFECPCCGGAVQISKTAGIGGKVILVKAEMEDQTQKKARDKAHAHASGEYENAKTKRQEVLYNAGLTKAKLDEARAAQVRLTLLEGNMASDGEETDNSVALQAEITQLEAAIKAQNSYHNARKVHEKIERFSMIAAATGADGVRARKLKEKVELFNRELETISSMFGGMGVTLNNEFELLGESENGEEITPFSMLSASEQYRVNAIIQTAIAAHEKTPLLIFDGADILDGEGRAGLLNMCIETKIPALICMTVNGPNSAPNLAHQEAGITYWLENGNLKKVA